MEQNRLVKCMEKWKKEHQGLTNSIKLTLWCPELSLNRFATIKQNQSSYNTIIDNHITK